MSAQARPVAVGSGVGRRRTDLGAAGRRAAQQWQGVCTAPRTFALAHCGRDEAAVQGWAEGRLAGRQHRRRRRLLLARAQHHRGLGHALCAARARCTAPAGGCGAAGWGARCGAGGPRAPARCRIVAPAGRAGRAAAAQGGCERRAPQAEVPASTAGPPTAHNRAVGWSGAAPAGEGRRRAQGAGGRADVGSPEAARALTSPAAAARARWGRQRRCRGPLGGPFARSLPAPATAAPRAAGRPFAAGCKRTGSAAGPGAPLPARARTVLGVGWLRGGVGWFRTGPEVGVAPAGVAKSHLPALLRPHAAGAVACCADRGRLPSIGSRDHSLAAFWPAPQGSQRPAPPPLGPGAFFLRSARCRAIPGHGPGSQPSGRGRRLL